jgi:hypothetical protein
MGQLARGLPAACQFLLSNGDGSVQGRLIRRVYLAGQGRGAMDLVSIDLSRTTRSSGSVMLFI